MEQSKIIELLAKVQGCSFAAIDTVTVPVLKGGKANPMQGKIEKIVTGSRIMLFTNKQSSGYENKVRRQLEREGKNPDSFVMGALPWGERVPDSPFIQHKGALYLQAVFIKAGDVEYMATENIDSVAGVYRQGSFIDKQDIPGLPDKTGSEGQGLDDSVIVRTYKLDSITGLRAFNESLS